MRPVKKVAAVLYGTLAAPLVYFSFVSTITNFDLLRRNVSLGDFVVTFIPIAALTTLAAIVEWYSSAINGFLLAFVVIGFTSLGLVLVSHGGGPLYQLAGTVHLVATAGGVVYSLHRLKQKGRN